MKFRKLALVIAATGLLGACGGLELGTAKQTAPKGDAFSKALYKEYVALSQDEYNEGDYEDSDVFAMRAIAAANDSPAAPEDADARPQPARQGKLLVSARKRLVAALIAGAGRTKPADAARAQAMYECWAQEQEENNQQDHIDRCRIQFFIALAKIEKKAAPPPPAKPKPKAKLSPLTFLIYFGFNSAELSSEAQSVIATAADVIKSTKPKVVSVTGHTDRSGASTYNAMLAEKRANAVAAQLTKMGVSGRVMTIGSLGENANAVSTGDGVKESGNRRVEVTLRY